MFNKSSNVLWVIILIMAAFSNYAIADEAVPKTPIVAPVEIKTTSAEESDNKNAATTSKTEKPKEVSKDSTIEVEALPPKPLGFGDFVGPRVKNYEAPVAAIIKENESDEHLACKITPTFGPDKPNEKPIKKSNNLMRKAGSPSKAGGDYIQITGMVTDENCMPISGAVVEIWQADSLGNYEWEYDQNAHFSIPLAGKDKNFMFSGRAQTDNRGQYYLITLVPGAKGKSAPHINVVIRREGYDTLHTRMYFAQHPRNDSDKILSSASAYARDSLIAVGRPLDPTGKTEGRLYYFPITMGGIGAYKRF